jgi:intracellular multiplication protein IcmJ
MPGDFPIEFATHSRDNLRQISRQVVRVVHERDHYCCRCCGFRSLRYQQILNPGGNWRDPDAILTACIFCQQCFLLDDVGDMRSGVLIAFPDIEQTELNRLAIELYVAKKSHRDRNAAERCLNFLTTKLMPVVDQFGSADPKVVVTMLRETNPEPLAQKLSGLRLLPQDRRILHEGDLEFNQFPQILAYWRSRVGPYPTDEPSAFPLIRRFLADYLFSE